jgi:small subunit ribosomal protein S27e
MSKSKFLRIVCPKCKNSQIIFGKSSIKVQCKKCEYPLTKPTGGKAKIRALINKILWR